MRESYPPTDAADSPAPDLPEREPEKFQFSLKQLLAFMLVSAVLAAGLRYVVQFLNRLPDHALIGWSNTILVSLTFGGLVYFFFRLPYLALQSDRLRRRWTAIRGHRRELESWSRERLKERELKPEAQAKE